MFLEAFLAGMWGSVGTTLGKFSGTASEAGITYIEWGLIVVMVVANTLGCRHYLRSLDACPNSVAPPLVSSSCSYVLSALVGKALFGEVSSVWWWAGATMIIAGLALVGRPRNKSRTV